MHSVGSFLAAACKFHSHISTTIWVIRAALMYDRRGIRIVLYSHMTQITCTFSPDAYQASFLINCLFSSSSRSIYIEEYAYSAVSNSGTALLRE